MLYIVPTPVGNVDDITVRAIKMFESAEIIITEDSRLTRKLFALLAIKNKPKFIDFTRNHEFNRKPVLDLFTTLQSNQDQIVLMVSDSGTPGISDPGIEIIRLAQDMDVQYTVLPGATALVPAVVASGIAGKSFTFLGFLPVKKGRLSSWKFIQKTEYPVVCYESVHRMEKLLEELKEHVEPTRKLSICREISKKFEEIWNGTVGDLDIYTLTTKGEFVIVIDKYE
jgi:16S rRNA (cytidine1402-2'-O)-methyltransferase